MTRALRDPRWLAGLAVAVVFAVICVLLAQWQLDRRVQRAERNAAVLENYDSAPVGLDEVVTDLAASPPVDEQWEPVRLVGRYDPAGTVLVRNRPQGGSNGYLVAVPFTTSAGDARGGTTLLLVRGWLPSGADAGSPGAVPDPPAGDTEVLARLRSTEEPSSRTAPPGQTYRLDVPALLAGAPGDVLTGAYAVVGSEDGALPAAMDPVPRPDTDPGPHLAYGVQWYLFALAGLGIWVVLARRHAEDLAGPPPGTRADGPAPRPGDPDAGPPSSSGSTPGSGSGWVYEPGRR